MCKFDIVELLQKLIVAVFVTILSTTISMKFFDLIICILMGHKDHRKAYRHDSGRDISYNDETRSEDRI